jgi:hypothetical protein
MSENIEVKRAISAEEVLEKAVKLIEIPGWEPGEFINVKARRMSLTSLIQNNELPNDLLSIIYKAETQGEYNPTTDNTENFAKYINLTETICKNVLVEPTYDEIGEYLTDIQKSAIAAYAQRGVRALENFRIERKSNAPDSDNSQGVRPEAK